MGKIFVSVLITMYIMAYAPKHFTQGITGKIYLRHGNYMPSPGRTSTPGKPVIRLVFVYELTKRGQTTENGTFFNNINSRLIAKSQSNVNGDYYIKLPPGRYSIFVKEDKQLYANTFDGDGNINPVEVKKDSISKKDIIISTNAVY